MTTFFSVVDARITAWMARHGVTLTRIALGIVFLWFGIIKFMPGWSPAAELATRTVSELTSNRIPPHISLPLLAAWESLIGIGLLSGRYIRATLLLLFVQMPGTMMPLFIFPGETFRVFPYAPTLEGQYIIKNLVLVAAAIMVGATARGGYLSSTSPPGPRPEPPRRS
jgi:uncharacterized membrane protein YkgB